MAIQTLQKTFLGYTFQVEYNEKDIVVNSIDKTKFDIPLTINIVKGSQTYTDYPMFVRINNASYSDNILNNFNTTEKTGQSYKTYQRYLYQRSGDSVPQHYFRLKSGGKLGQECDSNNSIALVATLDSALTTITIEFCQCAESGSSLKDYSHDSIDIQNFVILPASIQVPIKVNGVFKNSTPHIKVDGVFKQVKSIHIKTNGIWK